LAKKYKVKCIGVEISPLFYFFSKFKSLFFKNVIIKYGNLFRFPIKNCDIIYLFLSAADLEKLKDKILKEAKENAKIFTAFWSFEKSFSNASFYLYLKEKEKLKLIGKINENLKV